MKKQDIMFSIGKYLDEKFIYIYTDDSLLKFNPKDIMITFDDKYLKLKTNIKFLDVSVKYSSIKTIEFRNR